MIEYKLKEGTEDTIIKTGSEIVFTIRDIDNDIAYLEKTKKELVAQIGIEEAKKVNVLGTHPHIENMSEEDRIACYLYQQSYAFCKVGKTKIEEIERQIESYTTEKAEITKQIEAALPPVPVEEVAKELVEEVPAEKLEGSLVE